MCDMRMKGGEQKKIVPGERKETQIMFLYSKTKLIVTVKHW